MQDDKVSSISGSRTLEEMADFWDTHSLADYDDQTYEVEMSFEPSARRSVVTIEPELMLNLTHMARGAEYQHANADKRLAASTDRLVDGTNACDGKGRGLTRRYGDYLV